MIKNTNKLMMRAIFAIALIFANTIAAQNNTICDGGEYYLYNMYYNRCLGGNAENNGPALSKVGEDNSNFVWVAEASSLHEGWYWLRHKSTGKYLQASNKEGDTWSCWFAGNLNKAYNSYEWFLTEGIDGNIKSNRGQVINGSSKCYLGIDKGAEAKDYISVYYDKTSGDISAWQIVDAKYSLNESRLKLYTDKLGDAISRGESIYDNDHYGKPDELAVALYNARSAKEEASLDNADLMVTSIKALEAAITNALEGTYKILISGSSFGNEEKFIVYVDDINTGSDEEKIFLMRNSKKMGVIAYINKSHIRIGDQVIKTTGIWDVKGVYFSFNGKQVTLHREDKILGVFPMTEVPAMTSAGTSAEISIIGEKLVTSSQVLFIPGQTYENPQLNEDGKFEGYVIYTKGVKNDNIAANADIHYLATNEVLGESGSTLNIENNNTWIIFDNIRPSKVISKVLPDVKINGKRAINGTNCRVAIHLHGAVLYPYSKNDIALYGYSGELYSGEEYQFKLGANNNMGEAANMLQSFILKRGYMVCFSTNSDGSGYSRVYVADHEDKKIDVLPDLLKNRISRAYIRKWNWVSKKGWCSTESQSAIEAEGKQLGCTWYYSWSADKSSSYDMEYVPHKNHIYWPSWSTINKYEDATAVLGYNEPEHSEQHSDDCGTTIDSWKACTHQPEFMESGLRTGSPCPTDASWLTSFIKHCDDMAYRCDFVTFHAYWGTNEAANSDVWWSKLEQIYKNTGRPIWLTEWNNGASWTTEGWPSSYSDKLTKQKNAMKSILSVLDNASFIERYALYNWDSDYRAAIKWDSNKNSWWVTPCGEVYRDTHPTHAYNEKVQKVPVGWFPGINKENTFSFLFNENNMTVIFSIVNKNGDFTGSETIEYKDQDGEWKTFYDNSKKRSKFDSTKLRIQTISLDSCNTELMKNDKLSLRLRITTLKGNDTMTEECSVSIPESIKNHYLEAVGIEDITNSLNNVEHYTLGGVKCDNPTPGNVYIIKRKDGTSRKVTK